MQAIKNFLVEIDQQWSDGRVRLRIIGSTALMLQTGYVRGTKDSDVLETDAVSDQVKARLLELAGPDTTLGQRHKLYIDVVARGLPFLPQVPVCHPLVELNRGLQLLEFEVLDVVDVVVSKLKRFSANDAADIRAMADLGLVDHVKLLRRFRSAVDVFSGDARAEDLPRYVRNLNRVERDYLLKPESAIELPDWIG